MDLEKQVCCLELARRLKELGVKQKGLFVWCEYPPASPPWTMKYAVARLGDVDDYAYEMHRDLWTAFTVAELGEMLPNYFKHEQRGYMNLVMMKLDDGRSEIMYKQYTDVAFVERADTEADARAKMLSYLSVV
jgi:hypothetical protein